MPHSLRRTVAWLTIALWLVAACAPPASPSPASSPSTVAPSPAPVSAAPTAAPTLAPTVVPAPTSAPSPAASPAPTVAPTVATAPPVVSGERAYQHVQMLGGTIGSRPAGSPALDRAAAYAADQLASYGYRVDRQPFAFSEFQDKGSRLRATSPTALDLRPRTMTYSSAGTLTAELVSAGVGRSQDFGPNAKGRVVLIERGAFTFREKIANAMAAGAAAAIIANNQSGNFRGTLAEGVTIPVVSVSREEGETLRDLLRRGPVTVEVAVDAETRQGQAQNVIGSRPGPNGRWVVIGGHFDSVPEGPGANDNGSGIATILEIARAAAGRSYPFGLRFIAFSAEELGLVGSRNYVARLSEGELRQIVAMLNLDMVGVGERLNLGGSERLVDIGIEEAKADGQTVGRLGMDLSRGSDHASFMEAGVEALFFYRQEDPNYHTAGDTPNHVRPEYLAGAGRLGLKILDRLAGDRATSPQPSAISRQPSAISRQCRSAPCPPVGSKQ